jgi:hypothetical protein
MTRQGRREGRGIERIPMNRPLTEEEADEARYDACPNYFLCLGAGLRYWCCSPICSFYVPPDQQPEQPLILKEMEGIAKLLEELYPGYVIPIQFREI